MSKPVVRFVVDKDALSKLLPEGEIESQIQFDNAIAQLIQETGKRLLNESFIEAFEKRFAYSVKKELGDGWNNSSDSIDKIIGATVRKAIDLYSQEKIQEVVDKTLVILEETIKGRLNIAQKLIDQYTTPDGIEDLMINACAKLIKGKIK